MNAIIYKLHNGYLIRPDVLAGEFKYEQCIFIEGFNPERIGTEIAKILNVPIVYSTEEQNKVTKFTDKQLFEAHTLVCKDNARLREALVYYANLQFGNIKGTTNINKVAIDALITDNIGVDNEQSR
jgi:hypothetical protein